MSTNQASHFRLGALLLWTGLQSFAIAQPALTERDLNESYVDPAFKVASTIEDCDGKYACERDGSFDIHFGFRRLWLKTSEGLPTGFAETWFKQTRLDLRFVRLSRDAREIVARVRFSDPALLQYGFLRRPSDTLEFQLRIQVESCDGESLSADADPKSLPQRIAAFYERDLWQEFYRCELKIVSAVANNDLFLTSHAFPHSSYATLEIEPLHNPNTTSENDRSSWTSAKLSVLADDSIGIAFETKKVASTLTRAGKSDPAAAAKARQAVQSFIARLYDYTDLLLLTREKSPVERAAVVQAFMLQHRPELQRSLSDYTKHFGNLSLMEKISAQWNINLAYDYAKYFEREVARQPEINLDRELRSGVAP